MPQQDHPGNGQTTTVERGSFALAHCVCGWTGPARRSRDRARTDAREHGCASPSVPRPTPAPEPAPEPAPAPAPTDESVPSA
ncbi:hypothetical protein ACFQ61_12295 [Streptomyces sp. NPDC056500]|uniref:hypothetical protein n=1 Tax=Streptomyces sp. NPDC056500 TaxID=3345840 RepID=UPI0036B46193